MLSELNFAAGYPRGGQAVAGGESEYKMAWIISIVGVLCCTYITPLGVIFAVMAKSKGHPKASGVLVFSIIMLLIAIAWTAFMISIGGFNGLMKQLRS